MAEQAMERIQRQLAEEEAAGRPKLMSPEVTAKPRELSEEVKAGIEAGNINVDGGERKMSFCNSLGYGLLGCWRVWML